MVCTLILIIGITLNTFWRNFKLNQVFKLLFRTKNIMFRISFFNYNYVLFSSTVPDSMNVDISITSFISLFHVSDKKLST